MPHVKMPQQVCDIIHIVKKASMLLNKTERCLLLTKKFEVDIACKISSLIVQIQVALIEICFLVIVNTAAVCS